MQLVNEIFNDRKREIEAHIELLRNYENGLLAQSVRLEPMQLSVLKSCTFLLIYNMIESVIITSIKIIEENVSTHSDAPEKLIENLKIEWIKHKMKDIDKSTDETISKTFLYLLNCLKGEKKFKLEIKKGGGGNWSNREIYDLSRRLGVDISSISQEINVEIMRQSYDGKGCIEYVVLLRNKLAHGEISFAECGREKIISDITTIYENTRNYLEEIIKCFTYFIENNLYLIQQPTAAQQDVS